MQSFIVTSCAYSACVIIVGGVDKALEIFINNYSKMRIIVPVKSLSRYLVTERIINFEEEETIRQTVVQSQAASIVLRKIENSLKAGQTKSFDKLLIIMREHGGLSCEELANQIKDELLETPDT